MYTSAIVTVSSPSGDTLDIMAGHSLTSAGSSCSPDFSLQPLQLVRLLSSPQIPPCSGLGPSGRALPASGQTPSSAKKKEPEVVVERAVNDRRVWEATKNRWASKFWWTIFQWPAHRVELMTCCVTPQAWLLWDIHVQHGEWACRDC